ncbi:MAG: threonine/serine exporter family protein, partial [Lysobacteraceae bacterium]
MQTSWHALQMQRNDPVGRNATYSERIEFVVELARRLHTYGTTAERLEGAVVSVARRLGLRCDPFSNPTGIIMSFADERAGSKLADVTQMIRLEPGDIDLRKLCAADAIAEDVLADRTDIASGSAALAALDRKLGWRAKVLG